MIHMSRNQVIRLARLLHMRYCPSELASEIGCHVDTVYRSFIPAECPHERDDHGRIWIIGTEFAEWARTTKTKGPRLADGEAYCLKCNQAVKMMGPITVKPTNRNLELVTGTCPACGTTVNRARARRKINENTQTAGENK